MKKTGLLCLVWLAQSAITAPALAGEHGSALESEAMVKKAMALIKEVGPEKAYKAFTEHPAGQFKDRDLYVFVYSFDGTCLAQGGNAKMVGKNLLAMKDIDGNAFIAGMIDMAKTKGKGWYGPYKFNNVLTNSYEAKRSYCESTSDAVICVGTHITP